MIRPNIGSPPSPTALQVFSFPVLDGGLNLNAPPHELKPNQSPYMRNMLLNNGTLSSRPGQLYLDGEALGAPHAAYSGIFQNRAFFHCGTKLYALDTETETAAELYSGLTEKGGAFFVFGDYLYYLGGGAYLQIDAEITAKAVEPYIPVTVINRPPAGGGDLYQDENRLAAGKTVWFNADGTALYRLPAQELDETPLVITVYGEEKTEGTDFTVDRAEGTVTFESAPAQLDPPQNNGVVITYYKSDATVQGSILNCRYAEVFGGKNDVCVVVGGNEAQKNAYFWSGSNLTSDPSYFPFDYYNFAGNSDEWITGFGRQQSFLVILKERSVGKAEFGLTEIEGKNYAQLLYSPINSKIGCDVPNTVQLVDNNLVFANTYGGVYMLAGTSSANENNVMHLSRNVDGSSLKGLLYDMKNSNRFSSMDSQMRYWLIAGTHAYVWDYGISSRVSSEDTLSWFYLENIQGRFLAQSGDRIYFADEQGRLGKFADRCEDFGEAIPKEYECAVLNFGTYRVLKDVERVTITSECTPGSEIEIEYKSDYGTRKDQTPIRAYSWSLCPRNLIRRVLKVDPYSKVSVRLPRSRHIRHFGLRLSNRKLRSDMSLSGIQVYYKLRGEDR